MTLNDMDNEKLTKNQLDHLILSEYPYPIAINYQRLLEVQGWEARTRNCLELFEYSLRVITLCLLSQYLIRDLWRVRDPALDRTLYQRLQAASLGLWTDFFFRILQVYHEKRTLLFIPELYDLYWDTSSTPHSPRKGVRPQFSRLVEIRNNLVHHPDPASEEVWEMVGQEVLDHLSTLLAQFTFLKHYDLIRVIEKVQDEYKYEQYTGKEIKTRREPLKAWRTLRIGRFYLRRRDRSVLELHPLMTYWSNEREATLGEKVQQDVALYDRLLTERAEYVCFGTRSVIAVSDTELIAEIRQLIYYNLGHVKMARRKTSQSPASKPFTQTALPRQLGVFLCHASGDKPQVRDLYYQLVACNVNPWLDEESLLPGQDWQLEISKAVRTSDIVIICLSRKSITKAGYVQKEIKYALDVADEQPEGAIFLIPLKLEDCEVPERLRRWQWVNLYDEKGFELLIRALQSRAESLNLAGPHYLP